MRLKLYLTAAIALFGGILAGAQSVVLVPGAITGRIFVEGVAISEAKIETFNENGDLASTTVVTPNASAADYAVTVNVPQTGTATFASIVDIASDEGRDHLVVFPDPVEVSSTTAAQQNITLNPGFINPTVTVTGGTVASALFSASSPGVTAKTSGSPETGYLFAAGPGAGVFVSGTITLTDGRQVSLVPRTVTVTATQRTDVAFSVSVGAATATVRGGVSISGSIQATQFDLQVSGPASRLLKQRPVANAYSIEGLPGAANVRLNGTLYFNNDQNRLALPDGAFKPSRNIDLVRGLADVNVDVQEALFSSTLTFSGAPTLAPALASGSMTLFGTAGDTADGQADDLAFDASHTFDFVATPGAWRQGRLSVQFVTPTQNAGFDFEDRRPGMVTLTAGEVVRRDLALALGEATVTFTLAGGGTFSSPSISGSCDDNVQNRWSYTPFAKGTAEPVQSAELTFAGPEGTCTLTPSVTVGASTVLLNPITIDIIAGANQVVDLNNPTLSIASPSADSIIDTPSVVVTGAASDDVAVASVTVNGTPATLTANPADQREVSFSATVSDLQHGPNTIETVVTDTADPAKTTVDRRTIYFDTAAPSLTFTPADQTETRAAVMEVSGTADDDAGIASVAVNGTPVMVTSTGNSEKPHEVRFSATIELAVGQNSIDVAVTDISHRTTEEVHHVTRTRQVPTTLSVEAASATYGGQVNVSAVLGANGAGLAGRTIQFLVGSTPASATTDGNGRATVSVSIAGVNAGTHAGAIAASFAETADYGSSSATASLVVTPAPLTVTVYSTSKTQGAANPVFTAKIDGLVAGDNSSALGGTLVFSTAATQASPVGVYAVSASGLSSTNYAIRYVDGTLTVGYAVCTLYDTTKSNRAGSTVPIKLRLCGATGANLSSASIVLSMRDLVQVSTAASSDVQDAGDANPDSNFRYDAGLQGYIFNLKTTGLATGTWKLIFTASGSATTQSVTFQVR